MADNIDFSVNEVDFSNGRKARVLTATHPGDPQDWINALGLDHPRRVLWLSGSAGSFDRSLSAPLKNLFIRSVLKVAGKSEINALVMDGGTTSGVMEVMGAAVAEDDHRVPLLGVAPQGILSATEPEKAEYPLESNHSSFVLVPGENFGDEVPWMGKIAAALARNGNGASYPVVMILAGGNPRGISKTDVLTAVRAGYPVLIIKKTGGLADKLARLERKQSGKQFFLFNWFDWAGKLFRNFVWRTFQLEIKTRLDHDPELVEIIENGNLHFCALNDSASEIEHSLLKIFVVEQNKHKKSLIQAWQRFAIYDRQAVLYQNRYTSQQNWIMRLAVLTTLFAVSYSVFFPAGTPPSTWQTILNWLVIATPLIGSGMLAYLNKVNTGLKFVFLRGSAEAIKQAIYLYRTRDPQDRIVIRQDEKSISREQELAQVVEAISHQLMDSPVNQAGMPAYSGKLPPPGAIEATDDGLSDLSAANYVRLRLTHQRGWFQGKTAQLEKNLGRINLWIILFGMAGTFIAAIGFEAWVAVTTSIVTALSAYLNYRQIDQTLIGYNQTSTHLQNIEAWYNSLPAGEQKRPANITLLVSTTEKVLAAEVAGWVQNMKDSIKSLKTETEEEVNS